MKIQVQHRPGRVAYIYGEMPAKALQDRVGPIIKGAAKMGGSGVTGSGADLAWEAMAERFEREF